MNNYEYEQSLPIFTGGIHYHGPTIAAIQKYPEYLTGCVIDLGCSSGYHLFVTAESDQVTRAVGIDINKKKIDHTPNLRRADHPSDAKVEFVWGNLIELDKHFEENEFDCVESFHTLEHLFPEDLNEFFDQVKRVLKPNGYFMIIIPLGHNHDSPNEHHSWWSTEELRLLFELHNFETVFCEDYTQGQILGVFRNIK